MSKWLSDEWVNESIKWLNEWMNEQINEWMNININKYVENDLNSQLLNQSKYQWNKF